MKTCTNHCYTLFIMNKRLLKISFGFALIMALYIIIVTVYSITKSTSSTAGLGYIMLPFLVLFYAGIVWLLSWAILTLAVLAGGYLEASWRGQIKTFHAIFALILIIAATFVIVNNMYRSAWVDKIAALNTEEQFQHYFQQAVNEKDQNTLLLLALNPNIPSELLKTLKADVKHGIEIDIAIASNPSTQTELLTELAASSDDHILEQVAKHANTSVEILTQLADSRNIYVLTEVARNTNTPVNVLNKLSQSAETGVLWAVLFNPNVSDDILRQLSEQTSDENIARTAKWKLQRQNSPRN